MTSIVIAVFYPFLCPSHQTMGEDTQIMLETSSQSAPRAVGHQCSMQSTCHLVPGAKAFLLAPGPLAWASFWSGVPIFSTQTAFLADPSGALSAWLAISPSSNNPGSGKRARHDQPVCPDHIIVPLQAQWPISTTKPQGLLAVPFWLNLSFHDSS